MNATDLMMESQAVARVLGKANVKVEFGGKEAWNNGKVIRIPQLPAGILPQSTVDVTRGYTDHETAHSLFSDMELLNTLESQLLEITNYLEDPRIEKRYQDEYSGARSSFDALRHHTAWQQLMAITAVELKGKSIDWVAMIPGLVKFVASQMMGHGGAKQTQLVGKIPEHLHDLTHSYAARTLAAKDTAEVVEIAKELMKDQDQEQEKQRQKAQDKQDKKAEASNGQAGKGKGERQESDAEETDEREAPAMQTEAELLEHLTGGFGATKEWYNPALHVYGRELPLIKLVLERDQFPRVGISSMGAHAKSRLRRALFDVDDTRWLGGHVDGYLDPNDLGRAFQGEEDVYRRRTKDPEINACVTLLIDMSSSMEGERITYAAKTALMLAEGLEALGIPLEILGHTTMVIGPHRYPQEDLVELCRFARDNRHPNLEQHLFHFTDQEGKRVKGKAKAAGKEAVANIDAAVEMVESGGVMTTPQATAVTTCLSSVDGCLSSDPLVIYDLLQFGSRLRVNRDMLEKLPSIVTYYGGNNVDSRAIEYVTNRLSKRKEAKKIVLMLCDGIPLARGGQHKLLTQYTKIAVKDAEQRSVTLIGIGFGESNVAGIFSNHVGLNSIGQMEDVVLDVVLKVVNELSKHTRRDERYASLTSKVSP